MRVLVVGGGGREHALTARLAADRDVSEIVVAPEVPLSLGIADRFASEGHLLFGPAAAAARLESSKAFAKAFMARHHVPSAPFAVCDDAAQAVACVRSGAFG